MKTALPASMLLVALACVLHVAGGVHEFAAALTMIGALVFPVAALALAIFIVWQLASQARRRRIRRSSHLTLLLALFLVGGSARAESERSYPAQVLAVHDGDTITALIDLGFDLQFRTSVRLAHLDAPELPTPEGLRSRDALRALLLGQAIEVMSPGRDKYGRVLGVIYVGSTNVNALLLQRGLAKPYEGGKR